MLLATHCPNSHIVSSSLMSGQLVMHLEGKKKFISDIIINSGWTKDKNVESKFIEVLNVSRYL